MNVRAALAAWLQVHLQLAETLEETPVVDETALPAASVRYEGARQGDTLDHTLIEQHYMIGLFAPAAGGGGEEMADTLTELEEQLALALQSPARSSAAWDHIEAERVERGQGYSVWRLALQTRRQT